MNPGLALIMMARFYLATVVRTRRSLLAVGLSLAVLCVLASLRVARLPVENGLFETFMFAGPLGFLVQFAALFYGLAVVTEETEGGTEAYLLVRPIPRISLLSGRYLAAVGAVWLLASATCFAGWLLSPGATAVQLAWSVVIMLLGAACYVAIFVLAALLVRNALVVGVLYLLVVEFVVSAMPFNGHVLAVKYHLLSLFKALAAPQPLQGHLEGLLRVYAASPAQAVIVVSLVTAIALTVAAVRFLRTDLAR